MLKDIVIIGTSGCAREIAFLLEENNKIEKEWNLLGFVGEETDGLALPVLENDMWLLKRKEPISAVCAVGEPQLKEKNIKKYKGTEHIEFPVIVSKHALIGDRNKFGRGTVICAGATVTTDIVMGEFVTINLGTTICHQSYIGDLTTIAPGVNISGNVKIGEKCNIGVGAKIIQNIQIGNQTVIGAGGVVIRNLPDNVTAVGCPARVM